MGDSLAAARDTGRGSAAPRSYSRLTALDAAHRSGASALADWLVEQGAKTAADVA